MRAACCSMFLMPHLTGVCAVAAMLQLIGAEHALTRSSDCAMAKLIGFHGFDRPYRHGMVTSTQLKYALTDDTNVWPVPFPNLSDGPYMEKSKQRVSCRNIVKEFEGVLSASKFHHSYLSVCFHPFPRSRRLDRLQNGGLYDLCRNRHREADEAHVQLMFL